MYLLRMLALIAAVVLGVACTRDGSDALLTPPPVADLYADEDCWSLLDAQCYRGFRPSELASFLSTVGGALPAGLSQEIREVCEIIQAQLQTNARGGQIGIWLSPDDSTIAWTDMGTPSRRMAFRSPQYIASNTNNRFAAFHEGYHIVTGRNDQYWMPEFGMSEANYYGRMCAMGHL